MVMLIPLNNMQCMALIFLLFFFTIAPVNASADITEKVLDESVDKLTFPLTVEPLSSDDEMVYWRNHVLLDYDIVKMPSYTQRKAWLHTYIRNDIEGIGIGEVFNFQCQLLGKSNSQLCLIYWQWSQATTWVVMVDVVNTKGDIITRKVFDSHGAMYGILPYIESNLVIMERGIAKGGDVSCCPSGRQLEMYLWNEQGLTLLSAKRLDN